MAPRVVGMPVVLYHSWARVGRTMRSGVPSFVLAHGRHRTPRPRTHVFIYMEGPYLPESRSGKCATLLK